MGIPRRVRYVVGTSLYLFVAASNKWGYRFQMGWLLHPTNGGLNGMVAASNKCDGCCIQQMGIFVSIPRGTGFNS